jgi:hypothetical protein
MSFNSDELIRQTGIEGISEIESLNMDLIRMKLMDREDGLGWTFKQCVDAEIEYKRFLMLILLYPDERIVPSKISDDFWHYHILDTRKYYTDCMNIFGKFIHHYPYFGMFGKDDEDNLKACFDNTQKLYSKIFGELALSEAAACDGGSRCGRCNQD